MADNRYARFAKLPTPNLEATPWPGFMAGLQAQLSFELIDGLPNDSVWMDRAQIEQALQNLIRNAHESGSDAASVQVSVRKLAADYLVEVMDRGAGMTDTVLTHALVPFYSTKRSGTGLGLALTREIIEAHGGGISLSNRAGGGLVVSLTLPRLAGAASAQAAGAD